MPGPFHDCRRDFGRCGTGAFSRLKEVVSNPAMWGVFQYRFQRWVRVSFPRPIRWLLTPVTIPGQVLMQLLTHVQIPSAVRVGPGLYLPHTGPVVIGSGAVVGAHCTIAHNVTVGHAGGGTKSASHSPVVGDRVYIGPGAILIGGIAIGDDALIGAGAVVAKSIPARGVAVGNPARILSDGGSFDLIEYPGMESDPARASSLAASRSRRRIAIDCEAP